MKIQYCIFIVSLLLLWSCGEVIEWDIDSSEIKLVVEGRVTNELKTHEIKLTQSADYFDGSGPVLVTGANVQVSDGQDVYRYNEVSDGIYRSPVFAGVEGRTYTLQIDLESPLGGHSRFEAASQLLTSSQIDSLSSEFDTGEDDNGEESSFQLLSIYGTGPADLDNSYMFEVYRNNVLETDSITELGVFDDEFIDETFVAFTLYVLEDPQDQDSVTLLMYTIEDEFLEFIEDLSIEAEERDPLGLSSPPANVKGNFSNGAFGFFYAASVDTTYTILEDIP